MQADTVYRRGGSSGYAPLPTDPVITGPPLPSPLLPPRFGYARTEPTIMDVLQTTRLYPDARSRVSGYAEPGYSGTSRPATSWW